jgi:hypothetical protein
MQKQSIVATLAALACTAALAQSPAGNSPRPPSEVNPAASGGPAATQAQNKADQRSSQSAKTPMDPVKGDGRSATAPAEINPNSSGGKAAAQADARVNRRLMDTNRDGMVSPEERDNYQAQALNHPQPANTGDSTADLDKLNRTPQIH